MSEKQWHEKSQKKKETLLQNDAGTRWNDEKVRDLDNLSLWSKYWLSSVMAAEKKDIIHIYIGSL